MAARRIQPQGGVRVDPKLGIKFLVNAAQGPRDLVRNLPRTVTATAQQIGTPSGVSRAITGGYDGYLDSTSASDSINAFSVLIYADITAINNFGGLFARVQGSSTNLGFNILQRESNSDTIRVAQFGGADWRVASVVSSLILTAGPAAHVVVFDNGVLSWYSKGVLISRVIGITQRPTNTGAGMSKVFSSGDTALGNGKLFLGAYAPNVGWSEGVARNLSANPWQVFESKAPMLYASATEVIPTNLLGVSTTQSSTSSTPPVNSTQKLSGTFSGDVYLQEPVGNDVILYDPDWAINGRQANSSSTGAVTSDTNEVALQGTSTSQGNTTISGTLFSTQQLLGGAASQASHSSVGVVGRTLELSSAPLVQTNEAASVAVNTTKTLSFALATQSSTLGTGSITRDVALTGTGTAQSATAPVGFISLARELTGSQTTQGSHSSVAAAGGTGTLNAANDNQYNNSSSVGVSVTRTLSDSADVQQAEATVGSISAGHSLTGSDSGQSNNSVDVAISSATVHNLQGTITVSTGVCGSNPIAQVQVLSGQSATAVNVAAGVSISGIQVLGVSASVVQNTSSTGLLNSLVALVAAISAQVNSTPTSAIAQTQNLVAAATNAGCVVGTGVVGQVRFLTDTQATQDGTSGIGSVVIGALITVGDVHVTVEFNPYDVQFNSDKYAVTISNEPFDIAVTSRRA